MPDPRDDQPTAEPVDALTRAGRSPLRDPADVGKRREVLRARRIGVVALVLWVVVALLWLRVAVGSATLLPALPVVDPLYVLAGGFFLLLILVMLGSQLLSGRSPHMVVRPEQIDVGLDDVVGIDVVKAEVVRTLDLFLAHRTFAREMGGRPRRGVLFEGGPGTGKTHTAKALAKEAGVPFLMATATSFQSGLQGASQRKVRAFFRALRKAARQHGGAIGFIDEFDAIALRRNGMAMSPAAVLPATGLLGCGGLEGLPLQLAGSRPEVVADGALGSGDGQMTVNELLVQMQSFDQPSPGQKALGALTDAVNLFLPATKQLKGPGKPWANIMLIASTNTAERLDPALLRPGRFDQRLHFDLPDKRGRRAIVDHFLDSKAHAPELDRDERRDALAALTSGYSPAMLEGLLDEALVRAVEAGERRMRWSDVEHARLITEVGIGQPVGYTAHEERLIATHEAGHATVAHLLAPHRRLEVLTIIKRAGALGLLAHGDAEDVYTRSRSELSALVAIAMGGQVAEELFFDGDVSTGPAGDLQYATGIAAQMVGASGMAGTLVSFAAGQATAFSGDLVSRVLGDAEGRRMVEEVLDGQKAAVRVLLEDNRHLVAALRDALLERHELIGHEITDVLSAAGPAVVDLRDAAVADDVADDVLPVAVRLPAPPADGR